MIPNEPMRRLDAALGYRPLPGTMIARRRCFGAA
jgi:hypothetical protein